MLGGSRQAHLHKHLYMEHILTQKQNILCVLIYIEETWVVLLNNNDLLLHNKIFLKDN